jgi:hypothetical protein
MSAMRAGWTELSEGRRVGVPATQVQCRVDRRAEQKLARRSRQHWAIAGCSILFASFGLTVAVLELLH